MCSTVPPPYARGLGRRADAPPPLRLGPPVSGGVVGAEAGTLTIMASGSPEAFAAAEPALAVLSGNVYRLGDEAGLGSTVKMVNQLLAGVHIVAAAEAMALGTRAGASWMFG